MKARHPISGYTPVLASPTAKIDLCTELARAFAVLALVFFSLSTASPAISASEVVVREAGLLTTVVSDFCGHDQPQQAACHAPDCCRPGGPLLRPQKAGIDIPAFGHGLPLEFAPRAVTCITARVAHAFQSRGPPLSQA